MRRAAAALIAALVLPAAAGATMMPPFHGTPQLPAVKRTAKQNASCSEHGRQSQLQRLARKLAPVACEQPPRPKLRISLPGSFLSP